MGGEKRQHERQAVSHTVVVRIGETEFHGVVENLGALGALVSTADLETPLDIGESVTLRVETKAGIVEASGVILRLEQEFSAGDIRRSLAVKFDGPIVV